MSCNVLIVDDSPAMRKVIRRVLVLSGFDTGACLEAGDGVEALDVLGREPIDLVLTDVNMPNMNGEELIEHLSEHPSLNIIPVLVISTDRSDQRLCRMLALGARGYITKPFAAQTLKDELTRVMEEEAL